MDTSDISLFEIFKSVNALQVKRAIEGRTLQSKHLLRVTNAATMGICGELECRSICRILPSDVEIDGTLASLSKGTLKAKKIAKLAKNLEMQNRHSIHMFNLRLQPAWWAFSYTLNDLWATDRRHWIYPHIHLTSWLSHPEKDHNWLISKFLNENNPSVPHDFHIKFDGDIGQDMRFG